MPSWSTGIRPARICPSASSSRCRTAETFELTGGEVNANVYDRITVYEPGAVALSGGVAESWDVADDGHTIILHLRRGQ